MNLEIKVYSELNNIIENEEYFAIKNNNVIKYIDLTNNKMNVNINNDIITRENSDYLFTIDFNKNNINIYVKGLKKEFNKDIKVIKKEKTSRSYLVKYQLIDEDIINEYYIKF